MSKSRIIRYTCPYCGHQFDTEIWDTVNGDEDKDLREKCICQDLFRKSCPHCKKEFLLQFPMLYFDKSRKFILWLIEEDPGDAMKETVRPLVKKGYRLRRVPTINELCEKIEIFEDGVDDRLVELAKYDSFIELIDSRKAKPEDITSIEYQRTKDDVMKINIRMDDKGMSFLIPLEGLKEEFNQNRKLYAVDDASFPVVDQDWIIKLFQKPEAKA